MDLSASEQTLEMARQVEQAAAHRQEVLDTNLDRMYVDLNGSRLVHRPGDVGRDYINFAVNP